MRYFITTSTVRGRHVYLTGGIPTTSAIPAYIDSLSAALVTMGRALDEHGEYEQATLALHRVGENTPMLTVTHDNGVEVIEPVTAREGA